MEKLIKIKVTMQDGREKEYRTTSFKVKPLRDGTGLCIQLSDNYSIVCRSFEVEQKEIEPVTIEEGT